MAISDVIMLLADFKLDDSRYCLGPWYYNLKPKLNLSSKTLTLNRSYPCKYVFKIGNRTGHYMIKGR